MPVINAAVVAAREILVPLITDVAFAETTSIEDYALSITILPLLAFLIVILPPLVPLVYIVIAPVPVEISIAPAPEDKVIDLPVVYGDKVILSVVIPVIFNPEEIKDCILLVVDGIIAQPSVKVVALVPPCAIGKVPNYGLAFAPVA